MLLSRRQLLATGTITTLAVLAGCGGAHEEAAPSAKVESTPASATPGPSGGGKLTIYSGRNENLMAPLFERLRPTAGLDVEVRYGSTAEMAATILEEGSNSPADLFISQDAGALGALAREGILAPLAAATLETVDPRFRSPEGLWIGLSGRARVVVYNTDNLTETDLPSSIHGFTDEEWHGRLGWAPTNGSFQAFITAIRATEGDAAALGWLRGIVANDPVVFPKNTPIVEAAITGDIDAGFVNHYYLLRQLADRPDVPAKNHFLKDGDPGALVNVAGAGILASSGRAAAALEIVDFLLGVEAQRYFAESTFEYPLIAGVEPSPGLPPLDTIGTPDIDLSEINDLAGTLRLLQEAGVL
jgi:iron(III) transport system substrate-binding protein